MIELKRSYAFVLTENVPVFAVESSRQDPKGSY